MSQVLSEQSVAVESFVSLVRASTHATRHLSAQLTADHGLTISDLAEQVLLTASGVTRLLDGLEQSGWVERGSCDTDRRVVYAVLTDDGAQKLREASRSHVGQIEEYFSSRFEEEQLVKLNALLAQIEAGDAGECTPPE